VELKLRPYQQADIEFLTNTTRAINANDPGLGKTVEVLTARKRLGEGLTLIVGPKSSTGVWQIEAQQWYEQDSIIYSGTTAQRRRKWQEFQRSKCKILIVSYRLLEEVRLLQATWWMIIADEAHLGGLLNRKTDAWKAISHLKSKHLYLITGTPVRRGPHDLWALLTLLDEDKFLSYWGFVGKYCISINNGFGKVIEGKPKDPIEFKEMLSHYMVRHLKKDVLEDLPDKIRQVVPIEMVDRQEKLYNELAENMVATITGDSGLEDLIVTPNVAVQYLRLRQLLVTPQLLGSTIVGGALEALAELVDTEFSVGRMVAIFTPFRAAIPFIMQALDPLKCTMFIIHGEIHDLPNDVARRFQESKAERRVLISTIKAGISFTAHAASTAFFLGYEWSSQQNKQAEDRLHRFGQRSCVHIKYLLHSGTVDEAVMHRLDEKQMAENWILSPEEVLQTMHLSRKST